MLFRSLAPSRLALSLGLRNRNLNLPSGGPVDRDWIATVTKARNGRVSSLMPGTPFYDRDGVVGSELRATWSTGGPMVRGQPYGAVTVFLADWCEEGRLCASGHPLTGLFAWLRGLGRSA